MRATAPQLQSLLERAVSAGQALADARAQHALAQAASHQRRLRLDLLRLPARLEWWVRDDDWDARQRREHICIWPGLYRLRVWRLGPVGGAWGWELQTLTGTVLRHDIERRKRDAKLMAVGAAAQAVQVERWKLEQELRT